MNGLIIKLRTVLGLGLTNIARVIWYRYRLKSGMLKRRLPVGEPTAGPFFDEALSDTNTLKSQCEVKSATSLFGWSALALDTPPNWQVSSLNGRAIATPDKHWSDISDFDSGVGDIKGVWEASRFGWALTMAYNAKVSGDPKWVSLINTWIDNWSQNNPVNQGANWKCAQETSLRVLHLAAVARLLGQKPPKKPLIHLLEQHILRILPTLGYARAQDNNHGTSEAAALFVASSWLRLADSNNDDYRSWYKLSRLYLDERVTRLIDHDGTFSQYSLVYHRLMLDTLSFTELWRDWLELPSFSPDVLDRLQAATRWLASFIEHDTGDVPNIGANDGAHVLNFAQVPYRDFRPSVTLAAQLFLQVEGFSDEGSDTLKTLLSLEQRGDFRPPDNVLFEGGGFARASKGEVHCFMHVPKFRFRPSQADLLHLDLWKSGVNVLRDGGTFSYNADQNIDEAFSATAGHNTVEFDGRSQMPKLSRFLWGAWPAAEQFTLTEHPDEVVIIARYQDWLGARHQREVRLSDSKVEVIDTVSGFRDKACLRWRLLPGEWRLSESVCKSPDFQLQVSCDQPITRLELLQTEESRYYGKKAPLPVLEADVRKNATIKTIIRWG